MTDFSTSPWGRPVERFHFKSIQEFKTVLESISDAILETFRLHPFNNIDLFVNLHQSYRNQTKLNLEEFHSVYPLEFLLKDHGNGQSCVGLSLTVMDLISDRLPKLREHLFLVICNAYPLGTPEPEEAPSDEKALAYEHILVALDFSLDDRLGYVLVETGLLVDIPVVVMRDGLPPHTGAFRRQTRASYTEFCAEFTSPGSSFASWKTIQFKSETEIIERKRFVYLEKSFVRPEAVERRSLVFHFHGYFPLGVGGFKTGFYFVLGKDNERFSLIIPDETGQFKTVSIPYGFFANNLRDNLTNGEQEERLNIYKALEKFAQMSGLEGGTEAMLERFNPLSEACTDTDFIDQVKKLNSSFYAVLNIFAF